MKASDVYKLKAMPSRLAEGYDPSTELYRIRRWFNANVSDIDEKANTRLRVRHLADADFDGRRGWWMATLWFDEKPFAILQGAGRELDDHQECFVTDKKLFVEADAYLASLLPQDEVDSCGRTVINAEDDFPHLTEFYGCSLEQFHDESFTPRFKVGDVVVARIKQNHMQYNSGTVPARVEIRVVNALDRTFTYHGAQMDRRWPKQAGILNCSVMEVAPGEGGVGATFSDADVIGLSDGTEDPFELEKQLIPHPVFK